MEYFVEEIPCNGCGDVDSCVILRDCDGESGGVDQFAICMSCLEEASYVLEQGI